MSGSNNDRRESVQSYAQEEHETPPLPEEGGQEDPIDEYAAHAQQEGILSRNSSRDKNGRPNIERAVSTTSTQPPPVVKVPRSQRTGLLARCALLYEAEEPKDYPRKIKWLITLWIAMAATTAPMGSSIILRQCAPYQGRKRGLTTRSCFERHHPRVWHDCHDRQSFRCPLHALHERLSPLVVSFL